MSGEVIGRRTHASTSISSAIHKGGDPLADQGSWT